MGLNLARKVTGGVLINKPTGGITLNNDIVINGVLTLSKGVIDVAANKSILISGTGSITGGSSTSYINGKLFQTYSFIGSKHFPIGKAGVFAPATLTYTSLDAPSIVFAELFTSSFPASVPNISLFTGRYWSIGQTGATALNYNLAVDGSGFIPGNATTPVIVKENAGTVTVFPATLEGNDYTATGITGFSNFVLGTQCTPPTITTQPAVPAAICDGSGIRTVSVTATGSQDDVLSYQWQADDGSGFTNLNDGSVYSGAATSQLTITNPTASINGFLYRAIVSSSCAANVISDAVSLQVTSALTPSVTLLQTEGSNPGCVGNATTFTATALNTGEGTVIYNFKVDGISVQSSTVNTYTTALPAGTHSVTADISIENNSGNCLTTTTAAVIEPLSIVVNTAPTIDLQPLDQTMMYGRGDISFVVSASGMPIPTYQWQVNKGSGFTDIQGENTSTLTISNPAVSMSGSIYRVVITNSCSSVTSDNASLTISKADPVITVNHYDVTYDGNEHTATGTVTGVLGEALNGLNLNATKHTDAGDYKNDSWTFTDINGNYNDASGNVNNIIQKASTTTTISVNDGPYNGSPYVALAYVIGAAGLNQSAFITYSAINGTVYAESTTPPTDAGEYIVNASFDGNNNYSGSGDSKSFTITKANATITVIPYTTAYTGDPHLSAAQAIGVAGEDLTALLDVNATSHTNAGVYNGDNWTFEGNHNYNNTNGSVDNVITKAYALINVVPYSVTYDGNSHTAIGTAIGVKEEDLSNLLELSGTTHIKAGNYTSDFWTFAGNENYNSIGSTTFTDIIEKAPASIIISNTEQVYDGNQKAVTVVTTPSNLNYAVTYDGTSILPTSAGTYNVVATINEDNYSGSQQATLTIIPCVAPSIIYSGSTVICPGTSLLIGSSSSINNQWYKDGLLIPGETGQTLMVVAPGSYQVAVIGSCGSYLSQALFITPGLVPTINSQPSTNKSTYCQGQTAGALSVTASGSGLMYQWYSNSTVSNTGGNSISGATSATYIPSTATRGTLYYYVVISGNCGMTTSNVSGAIQINPATIIVSHPNINAMSYCQNTTNLTALSISATGLNLKYQWYSNTIPANTGGMSVQGATATSFKPATSTVGTFYYYCVVSGSCSTATSNVSGTITISAATAITQQPGNKAVIYCLNSIATPLIVIASGANLTYQWYSNTKAKTNNGLLIGGATSNSYVPPTNVGGTTYYYCVVSGNCGTLTSNISGAITVNAKCTAALTVGTRQVDVIQETSQFNVQVYPNPVITQFTVKVMSTNNKQPISVVVYDELGRVVDMKRNLSHGQSIQLGEGYKQGMYIVEMVQGENRKRIKILKTN
jgi:hypothetical protein